MIYMVVNEAPLCFADRLLDRMQLLGELEAVPTLVEHRNHAPHVALSALETLNDVRMGLVKMSLFHMFQPILVEGIVASAAERLVYTIVIRACASAAPARKHTSDGLKSRFALFHPHILRTAVVAGGPQLRSEREEPILPRRIGGDAHTV
jgi:hypothetical protein